MAMLPLVPHANYTVTFLVSVLLYITLSQAWNAFSGLTGYVSFGHVLFFGVGAYAFALGQVKAALAWPLCLLLGILAGAVTALTIAVVALPARMGVAYFAVLMLGLNEITLQLVTNSSFLGASYGITLQPMPTQLVAYYGLLLAATVVTGLVMWLRGSRFGLALRAMQTDEEAAAVAGVDCYRLKIGTFVLSAGVLGFAGALTAWYWRYIDPYMAFDLQLTFKMVIMTVFGGMGTVIGPIVGATTMTILDEWLSVHVPGLHTIIFGAVIVVLVVRLPGGVVDGLDLLKPVLGQQAGRVGGCLRWLARR
jgi:branched-chain amino acid transport system permease protein